MRFTRHECGGSLRWARVSLISQIEMFLKIASCQPKQWRSHEKTGSEESKGTA